MSESAIAQATAGLKSLNLTAAEIAQMSDSEIAQIAAGLTQTSISRSQTYRNRLPAEIADAVGGLTPVSPPRSTSQVEPGLPDEIADAFGGLNHVSPARPTFRVGPGLSDEIADAVGGLTPVAVVTAKPRRQSTMKRQIAEGPSRLRSSSSTASVDTLQSANNMKPPLKDVTEYEAEVAAEGTDIQGGGCETLDDFFSPRARRGADLNSDANRTDSDSNEHDGVLSKAVSGLKPIAIPKKQMRQSTFKSQVAAGPSRLTSLSAATSPSPPPPPTEIAETSTSEIEVVLRRIRAMSQSSNQRLPGSGQIESAAADERGDLLARNADGDVTAVFQKVLPPPVTPRKQSTAVTPAAQVPSLSPDQQKGLDAIAEAFITPPVDRSRKPTQPQPGSDEIAATAAASLTPAGAARPKAKSLTLDALEATPELGLVKGSKWHVAPQEMLLQAPDAASQYRRNNELLARRATSESPEHSLASPSPPAVSAATAAAANMEKSVEPTLTSAISAQLLSDPSMINGRSESYTTATVANDRVCESTAAVTAMPTAMAAPLTTPSVATVEAPLPSALVAAAKSGRRSTSATGFNPFAIKTKKTKATTLPSPRLPSPRAVATRTETTAAMTAGVAAAVSPHATLEDAEGSPILKRRFAKGSKKKKPPPLIITTPTRAVAGSPGQQTPLPPAPAPAVPLQIPLPPAPLQLFAPAQAQTPLPPAPLHSLASSPSSNRQASNSGNAAVVGASTGTGADTSGTSPRRAAESKIMDRTLAASVKRGELSAERALKAARWVDKEIRKLIGLVVTHGSPGGSRNGAVVVIKYGDLFKAAEDTMEALSGTLKTAKKQEVVAYDAEVLFQGQFHPTHTCTAARYVCTYVYSSRAPLFSCLLRLHEHCAGSLILICTPG